MKGMDLYLDDKPWQGEIFAQKNGKKHEEESDKVI